jgi:cytochrome c oxidase subunit 3
VSDHAHPTPVAHQFDDREQQTEVGRLGMWLFLATEILLFGGLFVAYAVYRSGHPEIFIYAHRFLNKALGGTNTVVLICSSLTMAWAVRAAQLGQRRLLVTLLVVTLALAGCFLGIKGIEYQNKWKEGLLWGARYHPVHEAGGHAPAARGPAPPIQLVAPAPADRSAIPSAATGPAGLADDSAVHVDLIHAPEQPRNVHIFFGIYFAMTGLHALHVIAGMSAIGWILRRSLRGEFGPAYNTPVDLVGLYWHLVDIIWIFLFPLLYLIH